jgi:hypothetical protein
VIASWEANTCMCSSRQEIPPILLIPKYIIATFLVPETGTSIWRPSGLYSTIHYNNKMYHFTLQQAMKSERVNSYTLYLASALDVGVWSTPGRGRFTHGIEALPAV